MTDSAPDRDSRPLKLAMEWKPWHRQFWESLRDAIAPPALPPLKVTAKAVQVRSIWSKRAGLPRAQAVSLLVHAAVIGLLFAPAHRRAVSSEKLPPTVIDSGDLWHLLKQAYPDPKPSEGGGGSGNRDTKPATRGKRPPLAMIQLTPALPEVRNFDPKLIAEPTLIVPPEIQLPNLALPNFGDPAERAFTNSGGPGSGGSFGEGEGTGIGPGRGPGYREGAGGGYGDRVFRPGVGGVTEPQCDFCPAPLYSEEARRMKQQGNVLLRLVVTPDGRAANISVVRGPGMGLEERAVEAVRDWRFKPARGPNGMPVAVLVTVEVNFRLL